MKKIICVYATKHTSIFQDTTVLINVYAVHHDQEYWKDPEEFRPERFLDNQNKLISHERVLTFGLGIIFNSAFSDLFYIFSFR